MNYRWYNRHATTFAAVGVVTLSQTVACSAGTDGGEPTQFEMVSEALSTNATYEIRGVQSGRCLDIWVWGTNDGDNLNIWDCTGGLNQQFKFEAMDSGYYRLRNMNSNKCLDVWGWSSDNGGDVRQYTCTTGWNQQWLVTETGNGATFKNRHSGKMMDVWAFGTANGTNIAQWDATGNTNQLFYLNALGSSGGGSNSSGDTCTNPQGTNAVMAAIAVAMGKEMGRWEPLIDLQWGSTGLQVSAAGRARCSDGQCAETAALLSMQDVRAWEVTFPGGAHLDPGSLVTRLAAAYNAQAVCESRPDNGYGDDCPAEDHQLRLNDSWQGSCDTIFEFQAKAAGGSSNLSAPDQLKNKLLFAGYPSNPYLDFQSAGDWVSIDPTYGLNEAGTTSSGSCSAACTKISATDLRGDCCSCNSAAGSYVRSAFSSRVYLCR